MDRCWIDLETLFLPAAADRLIRRASAGRLVDMEHIQCVTPGRRAGRELLESLIRQCADADRCLVPPRMLTPGLLHHLLPSSPTPTAMREERVLAWARAIALCDRREIAALLPAEPDQNDELALRGLAETIEAMHEELAGQMLRFSDVPARAQCLEMFAEGDRWEALQAIARQYRKVLASCGLVDPHEAIMESIRAGGVDDRMRLVLIGVTELNARQRAIITKFDDRVDILIHAPEEMAERFDDLGCVVPDAWQDVELSIANEQIVVAGRPADQAHAAIAAVAALSGEYAADQITLGLGDTALAGPVERAAAWAGLAVHAAAGSPLRRTGPYRALEAIAAWLEDPRFANFAALLRHPDVERRLRDQVDAAEAGVTEWLALLDKYFSDHLHGRLAGRWLGRSATRERLKAVWDAVQEILAPLRGPDCPLAAWAGPLLEVLATVYERPEDEPAGGFARSAEAACLQLRDAFSRLAAVAPDLQPATSAAGAIELLLAETRGEAIVADVRADQIDMLGWLELHLDPAPVLILLGCNDGSVPEAVSADLFLPDALRRALGLMHNAQRYARDAYLLEATRRSRKRLTIITGRRTDDGELLQPSRLLLACDAETMLRRVRLMCAEEADAVEPLAPIGAPPPGGRSLFEVPALPEGLSAPESMTVTEFRAYLACPYRYALSRILKLGSADDAATELDALQFGTLAHDVLDAFGSDASIRDTDDPQAIEEYLLDALSARLKKKYGASPMPAVRLQAARLAQRMKVFAQRQAELRAAGWTIRHSEFKFAGESLLDIPGDAPMPIRGKIDRIDCNENTGAWRIIDYKTGERGDSPHKAHHGVERLKPADEIEWQDLQLPLYHYLAQQHGIIGAIELGYVVLPKSADDVALKLAEWSSEHLEAAIDTAREVVRKIRAGHFERNLEYDSSFDDFTRICQAQAFTDAEDSGADGGGGDA